MWCSTGGGYPRAELEAAVREHKADLPVLGKPAGDESVYAFRELKNLAANIEAETEFGQLYCEGRQCLVTWIPSMCRSF
jgi:hypothetical protein